MDEPDPAVLRVALLGTPAITWAGETHKVPRRQVRALLFRLAAENKPLSRSYLCELFWSGLPENSARQNLSRLLVYLNRAVPDHSRIQANDVQVQLHPEAVQVDTRTCELLWNQWLTLETVQPLQEAAGLYRGPFLEGFYLPDNPGFEAWVQEQAAFWEGRTLKTLALLLEDAAGRGDYPAAGEYARQVLAINELAEDVHLRLIELYAAAGDRPAALRQYELCATVLERELGLRPAPETRAAYQAVLEGNLPGQAAAPEPPDWVILPGLPAPLIGRQEILEELEAHLGQARSGHGRVVLIHGEPGIGKSRLMQAFTRPPRLRTQVLLGSGLRECCTLPFQPLILALSPVLRSLDLLSRIPPAWLAEAARLFPEIGEGARLPRPPEVLNPEIARSRLFEALFRLLAGCTDSGHTLILCLDDLHWADATTRDWLVYAASRIGSQRILLLASCRSDELETLGSWLGSLRRLDYFHEIQLSGLESADIARLAGCLPGQPALAPGQCEVLAHQTGGNPFFVLETLRMMLEAGLEFGQGLAIASLPVPQTVQSAVAARLQNLRPQVRQTLEAASVLGTQFAFDELLQTSGRPELEILDGLDELVARQFLAETSSGHEFCHAIIREAVYASLSSWRRKKLNERAGLALEKLRSENWSLLAWYFEQAGRWGQAAHYAQRAGQAAREIFAHQEARGYFDHALALRGREAAELQGTDALQANWRAQIELLYERGWAFRLLGDMHAYTRDLEQVAQLARRLDDPRALAHLHWQQAYNHRWFCRYPAAQAAAEAGLLLSRQCGDTRLEAHCRRELGLAARETGDYANARRHLEAALAHFQELGGETVATLHTLGNLSTLHLRAGELAAAEAYAWRALEICEQSGLDYERRLPLGDLGAAAAAAGDIPAARKALQESLEIGRQIADCTQEIFCLGQLGWLERQTGVLDAARQSLGAALAHAEKIASLSEQSWLHLGLAYCNADLGDLPAAAAHGQRALEIGQALGRTSDQRAAAAFLAGLKTTA